MATKNKTLASDFANHTEEQAVALAGPLFTEDQKSSGILACVSLAQFILESAYGKSELCRKANNAFGMKVSLSGNSWPGSTWNEGKEYLKQTQEQKEDGTEYTITAHFRKYDSIEDSIADHSAYLLGAMNGDVKRYAGLDTETDYKKAAEIIKAGGYATDVNYVEKLCGIIEKWNLTQYNATEDETEYPETITKGYYRVRTVWTDTAGQLGAFRKLSNAKKLVDENPSFHVFANDGTRIYPKEKESESGTEGGDTEDGETGGGDTEGGETEEGGSTGDGSGTEGGDSGDTGDSGDSGSSGDTGSGDSGSESGSDSGSESGCSSETPDPSEATDPTEPTDPSESGNGDSGETQGGSESGGDNTGETEGGDSGEDTGNEGSGDSGSEGGESGDSGKEGIGGDGKGDDIVLYARLKMLMNIRSAPSLDSDVITTYKKGAIVEVAEVCDGEWYKIICAESDTGYAYMSNEDGQYAYTGSSIYTVQVGDTLWSIADAKLGDPTRNSEIKTLNGLASTRVDPGLVLLIP